jgi:hypothetical protein
VNDIVVVQSAEDAAEPYRDGEGTAGFDRVLLKELAQPKPAGILGEQSRSFIDEFEQCGQARMFDLTQ